MEFFANIWAWFVAHKDEIVIFLTSSSFIGLVTAAIGLWRQHRAIKSNTATGKELSAALTECRGLTAEVHELKTENTALAAKVSELTDIADNSLAKVAALLEVQSVVYNYSLRDDKTRSTVMNIITNAKYNETATRAALIAKIENLESNATEMRDRVKKTSDEIRKTLTAEEKPEVVLRG